MKKYLAMILALLCALTVLAGCGKKAETGTEGSGEAVTATDSKDGKSTQKNTKTERSGKTAETPEPTSGQESGSKTNSGGKAGSKTNSDAKATPTPTIENWQDVEQAQEQLLETLSVNPVGNWQDSTSQRAMMVIDDAFRVSILWTQDDGTNVLWAFSGEYDPEQGVLTYTDGIKQVQGANAAPTVAYRTAPADSR